MPSGVRAQRYRVISVQDLRLSRFRTGVPSAVPESAGPFDQGEGMASKSIKLPWIALASSVFQSVDSSAAKLLRVL
jgi:hypothetical protein